MHGQPHVSLYLVFGCINFSRINFNLNIKNSCVNCLQGSSFWQLTLTGKTDIRFQFVQRLTYFSVIIKQNTHLREKKVNPAVYAKRKWLSGFADINAPLSVPIHHKIILVPTQI